MTTMKKTLLGTILFLLFFGLLSFTLFPAPKGKQTKRKLPPKLARLYQQPTNRVIEYCDLSYQNLKEVPNLTKYHIKHLNLSHNKLGGYGPGDEDLIIDPVKFYPKLPKGLERLDMSHNNLIFFDLYRDDVSKLKQVDASYNRIRFAAIPSTQLQHCNLAHNKIYRLDLAEEKIHLQYLDISHNPHYSGGGLDKLTGLDTLYCQKCSTEPYWDFNVGYKIDTLLVKKYVDRLPYKIKVLKRR